MLLLPSILRAGVFKMHSSMLTIILITQFTVKDKNWVFFCWYIYIDACLKLVKLNCVSWPYPKFYTQWYNINLKICNLIKIITKYWQKHKPGRNHFGSTRTNENRYKCMKINNVSLHVLNCIINHITDKAGWHELLCSKKMFFKILLLTCRFFMAVCYSYCV